MEIIKLTSLAWPAVFVGLFVLSALIFLITTIYSKRRRNILQVSESRINYYVLTSEIVGANDHISEEISSIGRRYNLLVKLGTSLLLLLLLASFFLAGRPADIFQTNQKMQTRDIVLCLDVSGSTLSFDKEILQSYRSIVDGFSGERIALSIFDSTSRTIFPLTDDYNLVKDKLDEAIKVLAPIHPDTNINSISEADAKKIDYFLAGTSSRTDSASLIGDGLANCALQFGEDNNIASRSKSVVFSTDNILSGTPIFTLDEAAELSLTYGVQIFGIYSGQSQTEGNENEVQMKNVIQNSKGKYFFAGNANMIPTIVGDILSTQLTDMNPNQDKSIVDYPALAFIVCTILLTFYLIIAWRLKQ